MQTDLMKEGYFPEDMGGGTYSDVTIDRCYFLGNKTVAASIAGAYYYRGFGNNLVKNMNTVTNSVFMFNDGAIAALAGKPGISNTRIANCSFYKNGENPFVKYWGSENNPIDLDMKMQFLNCVIWEPQTAGAYRVFFNNDPANFSVNDYQVEHSLVHLQSCAYNGFDPCDQGMIYGQWPDFLDAEFGNTLEVYPGSPVHNKGNNLVTDTFGLTKDHWGNPRICGDTVDMGAYEIQLLCTTSSNEPVASTLPFEIRLLQNPVYAREPIRLEIFSTVRTNVHMQFFDVSGRVLWQTNKKLFAGVPEILEISSQESMLGLYFLTSTDEQGHRKTEKVIIQ